MKTKLIAGSGTANLSSTADLSIVRDLAGTANANLSGTGDISLITEIQGTATADFTTSDAILYAVLDERQLFVDLEADTLLDAELEGRTLLNIGLMGRNIKFLGDGEEFDAGDTITFEATIKESVVFEDAENLADPSTKTITITDSNNDKVVDAAELDRNDLGEFFYSWDTTGLSAGDYEVVVNIVKDGKTKEIDEWIRLTD